MSLLDLIVQWWLLYAKVQKCAITTITQNFYKYYAIHIFIIWIICIKRKEKKGKKPLQIIHVGPKYM